MSDRGEKIIHLAREMLRSDVVFESAPPESKNPISFKVLCLATVLAAFSSAGFTEWNDEHHRPINRFERTD